MHRGVRWRTPMNWNSDWFYILLTILVFAVLWLIVRAPFPPEAA